MSAILEHPANAGVVRSLCRRSGGAAWVVAPDVVRDPYAGCGSHPDIVERVWEQLGRELPPTSRRILCGCPVLVHPDTGMVLAVCYGTQYCLRVPEDRRAAAMLAGCTTSHRWSTGEVTDLGEEFGPDWLFGCWAREEAEWCSAAATGAKERSRDG